MRLLLLPLFIAMLGGATSPPDIVDTQSALPSTITEGQLRRWQARAQSGDAEAMNSLGQAFRYGVPARWPADPASALQWFQQARIFGSAAGAYHLLEMKFLGEGGPADQAVAIEIAKELAEKEYPPAQATLSAAYFQGLGVPSDPVKGLALAQKAAAAGDSFGQWQLGRAYHFGKGGLTVDFALARKWYELAAEHNLALAQRSLGLMHANGTGVPQDKPKAITYFRLAAGNGNAGAARALGFAYRDGTGVTQDAALALYWHQQAANLGDAVAEMMVGSHHFGGVGTPLNVKEARYWFNRAAQRGYPPGMFWLGFSLAYAAQEGYDPAQATTWLERAVTTPFEPDDWDHTYAVKLWREQTGIAADKAAEFYETGNGVPQNGTRAIELYKQGAEAGNTRAETKYGLMIWFGKVLGKSDADAVQWFRLAAASSYAPAETQLGFAYGLGRGVAKDIDEAAKWYALGAQHGDLVSLNSLAAYYWGTFDGVPRDDKKAVVLALEAVSRGSWFHANLLSTAYRLGRGVPVDAGRAVHWMRQGAERGDERCLGSLGYSFLTGYGGLVPDRVEAAALSELSVERTEPGVELEIVTANYRNATTGMTVEQRAAVKQRAEELRDAIRSSKP